MAYGGVIIWRGEWQWQYGEEAWQPASYQRNGSINGVYVSISNENGNSNNGENRRIAMACGGNQYRKRQNGGAEENISERKSAA